MSFRSRSRVSAIENAAASIVATASIFYWQLTGTAPVAPTQPPKKAKPRTRYIGTERERAINRLLRQSVEEWTDDNIVMAEMIFEEALKIRDMTDAEFNKL